MLSFRSVGITIGPACVGVCVLCVCVCVGVCTPVPRMRVPKGARGKCVSEQMLEATPACPSSSWRLEDPAAAGIKVVFHSFPPHPHTPPTHTHTSSPCHGPLQQRTNDIKGARSCRRIGTCVRCGGGGCEMERLQICFSPFILSVAAEYLKRLYRYAIHQNICTECCFFFFSHSQQYTAHSLKLRNSAPLTHFCPWHFERPVSFSRQD